MRRVEAAGLRGRETGTAKLDASEGGCRVLTFSLSIANYRMIPCRACVHARSRKTPELAKVSAAPDRSSRDGS